MHVVTKRRMGVLCALLCGAFTVSAQVYVMGNLGTVSTCSGVFYDSGNSGAAYGNNENFEVTFCSSSGLPIYLNFSAFRLETTFDSMYIYDGNSTSAPLIGGYSGTTSPGAVVSTNGSNCLTVTFKSDGSVTYIGWIADVGCGTPPPPPPPSAGTTCAISQAFCSGTAYNFPAATNTTAEVGPDYDCLTTQPNPVWYYLQIENSGDLDISLANTANVDVDFVCWGPFANSNACSQLTGPNVVDCSYSIAATEHVDIDGAVAGQYYILCITNFSNQPTNFTLSTDGTSTASTNCLILCNITAMTAIPGACNPADNTHDVSGTLTVQYPPSSGTLTITAGGQVIVLNPPFANSINYSIPGLNSTGGPILVDAQFSTDTSCHFTSTYTSPAPCTCSVTATNNSPVCGGTPVTLTATVTGVIDTYQWAGPNGYTASTQNPLIANPTVAQSGIYSVTITSGACTATDTTEVQVLDAPTFTATVTNATCNGASDGSIVLALTSAPPATYSWAGNVSYNETALNLAAGIYIVTVTGGPNNCSVTASYTVTEPTVITLGAPTITDATCAGGGSIAVTASGGTGTLTYSWSTGGTTGTIGNLAAGPYDLTVTDQNLCSTTATYTVGAAPGTIVFGAPVIVTVSCFGAADGSITVTAAGGSGPVSYAWGNANGQTTPTISGLTPNVYSVVASDANGCSASVSYLITEPTQIVFDAPVIVDATCSAGGSIAAGATGGTGAITFAWSNGQSGATISNVSPGTYQVTASDQNLCTATAAYTVNPDPNSVILSAPVITSVSCAGLSDGSVTVNATGGNGTFVYTWSTTPAQYTATATGLSAGIVSVTVADGNNCSATASYIVPEAVALTTTVEVLDATCNMAANGSITARPAGGAMPYAYQWSDINYQTTQTAMGLTAGTYTVLVTDMQGCTATGTGVVNEPADLTINTSSTPVKCVGESNGTITIAAFGGTVPYNYVATPDGANFIYPPGSTSTIAGLAIGTYTVIVSDSFGCTRTVQAVVPNAALDNFTTATDSTSCYGADYNDGAVYIITTSPQNGPYQYSIDNGISQYSGDFYNISAGAHTITATSYNNCVSTIPVLVLEPLPIVVDVIPDTVRLPLGQGQQVQVTYLNANGDVTYIWTPELGLSCTDCPNPLVSPFVEQDYLITISTQNGSATCYGSATLHAEVTTPLPLFIPNSFSPNGDGNNDIFQIYGQGIKTVDLKVFNRWGELVYKSNNQFSGWDGTYKGQIQQPSVFTYSVQVTFLDDTKASENGSVTLIR